MNTNAPEMHIVFYPPDHCVCYASRRFKASARFIAIYNVGWFTVEITQQ